MNTIIKTSDGKEYEIENDCLIRKSEAIKLLYEKCKTINNEDTQNGLAAAVNILYEMKGARIIVNNHVIDLEGE